jgi:hypothetical protein
MTAWAPIEVYEKEATTALKKGEDQKNEKKK